MIAIPVIALISIGIASRTASESTITNGVKFRVIPVAGASRASGLRIPNDDFVNPQPSNETPLSVAPGSEPILFASNDGEGYVIQAAPGFVAAYQADKQQLISDLNRQIAFVVAAAAVVAAVVAFLTWRRILGPVESLTVAARRMEAGDLTQRVPVGSNDELAELGRAFNAMAASLEHTEQLRKTMTSDVAHELRTPLNNLSGYLDAIADGVVDADPDTIASLQEEAGLLVRLVADLEQLALADAGHSHLVVQTMDLGAAARRAAELVAPRAAAKGVRVQTTVAGDVPRVEADPARIDQVVRNLLENAIRHTPAGGTVSVSVAPYGGNVHLEVSDTGPGIPPEHIPNVFERFYRADPSRSRATGGAGLGLAIVQQLVDAHGGSVAVANVPGAGACFTVSLPRAIATSVA